MSTLRSSSLALVLAASTFACRSQSDLARSAAAGFPDWSLALYPALAPAPAAADPATEARVALGRMIFNQPFVANGRTVSCRSCHSLTNPAQGRVAGAVLNAGGRLDQLPDSGAANVEKRSEQALTLASEIGMPDPTTVVAQLERSPQIRAAFAQAFPDQRDPITFANVGIAIGAFVRQLVTPSRWDRFVAGDTAALTPEEKEGFATFVNVGCSECHNGVYVGARMYRKLGVAHPWPVQVPGDRSLKVASLRNVAAGHGPYFHFGDVADLPQAVRMMGTYQTGTALTERQVDAIVAWLRTLTGKVPTEAVATATRQ